MKKKELCQVQNRKQKERGSRAHLKGKKRLSRSSAWSVLKSLLQKRELNLSMSSAILFERVREVYLNFSMSLVMLFEWPREVYILLVEGFICGGHGCSSVLFSASFLQIGFPFSFP